MKHYIFKLKTHSKLTQLKKKFDGKTYYALLFIVIFVCKIRCKFGQHTLLNKKQYGEQNSENSLDFCIFCHKDGNVQKRKILLEKYKLKKENE